MPTPRQGYHLEDGTKVPGTTTIIGRFKESGGLINWAYKQGREHEALSRQGKDAPRHLRDVVSDAADAGTIAHGMVEAHINGDDPEKIEDLQKAPEDTAKKARGAFGAYLSWEKASRLEIVDQEMQLVSEEYKFGGTPDALGLLGNELVLVDWKTSNGVYSDMLIQLAAYGHLVKECMGKEVQGFHLCRFAKEHGDFAHHYYPDLSEAWRQFVLFREAYEIDKGLKKRAA